MGSMATFNVKKNNAYLFLLCSRNHVTNYLATLCPNFLILHLYNLTSLTSESEFKGLNLSPGSTIVSST